MEIQLFTVLKQKVYLLGDYKLISKTLKIQLFMILDHQLCWEVNTSCSNIS